ncbi:hypothetical protein OC842_002174 [Tilletia horrida]|uniref:Uncharacterized protein n=1 Tax=Tilletia horrida TaxID=155126 RepID=A0AAN6JLK9_9BASI|nr:hypothetical protein OC842_002174 [Tilletia horrida]
MSRASTPTQSLAEGNAISTSTDLRILERQDLQLLSHLAATNAPTHESDDLYVQSSSSAEESSQSGRVSAPRPLLSPPFPGDMGRRSPSPTPSIPPPRQRWLVPMLMRNQSWDTEHLSSLPPPPQPRPSSDADLLSRLHFEEPSPPRGRPRQSTDSSISGTSRSASGFRLFSAGSRSRRTSIGIDGTSPRDPPPYSPNSEVAQFPRPARSSLDVFRLSRTSIGSSALRLSEGDVQRRRWSTLGRTVTPSSPSRSPPASPGPGATEGKKRRRFSQRLSALFSRSKSKVGPASAADSPATFATHDGLPVSTGPWPPLNLDAGNARRSWSGDVRPDGLRSLLTHGMPSQAGPEDVESVLEELRDEWTVSPHSIGPTDSSSSRPVSFASPRSSMGDMTEEVEADGSSSKAPRRWSIRTILLQKNKSISLSRDQVVDEHLQPSSRLR